MVFNHTTFSKAQFPTKTRNDLFSDYYIQLDVKNTLLLVSKLAMNIQNWLQDNKIVHCDRLHICDQILSKKSIKVLA